MSKATSQCCRLSNQGEVTCQFWKNTSDIRANHGRQNCHMNLREASVWKAAATGLMSQQNLSHVAPPIACTSDGITTVSPNTRDNGSSSHGILVSVEHVAPGSPWTWTVTMSCLPSSLRANPSPSKSRRPGSQHPAPPPSRAGMGQLTILDCCRAAWPEVRDEILSRLDKVSNRLALARQEW